MEHRLSWYKRLAMILGVVAVHGLCYQFVNLLNSQRPLSAFFNFHTVVDDWIPYIPWTLVFYYLGDIYILFFAPVIVWKLSETKFVRAVYVFTAMIISGALIQLALPCQAPWPNHLSGVQAFVHNSAFLRPYACLPSMHVALTVLPTCLLFWAIKSNWIRGLSTLMAVLITASIATTKEHFFLDAVTGAIFAFFFFLLWRRKFKTSLKDRWRGKDGNPER
jgi:hypothetical protein